MKRALSSRYKRESFEIFVSFMEPLIMLIYIEANYSILGGKDALQILEDLNQFKNCSC
jgi:hypothetical protein